MSEHRCKWCYRTIGEIRAAIEAQGDKAPARIFNRDDAWCRCVLCLQSKKTSPSSTTTAPGQPAIVLPSCGGVSMPDTGVTIARRNNTGFTRRIQ